MKYLQDKIERKIVVDDSPFTEAESHFTIAKFYLKNYIVKKAKLDNVKLTKSNMLASKRIDVVVRKVKASIRELESYPDNGKIMSSKKKPTFVPRYVLTVKKEAGQSFDIQGNVLGRLTLPIKCIDAINLSLKLLREFVLKHKQRLLQSE